MEDEQTSRGGGVDVLRDAAEDDPLSCQVVHRLNQVRKGTGEAIQPPYNEGVTGSEVWECFL